MLVFSTVTPEASGSRRESPAATTGLAGNTSHLQYRVEQSYLGRAPHLGVFVTCLAVAVNRQYVERTAPAVAAAASVELEAEHGKRIQANTYGALGEARLESGNHGMPPGLGVAVVRLFARWWGHRIAIIAVEVEVAVEHAEGAALHEAVRTFLQQQPGCQRRPAPGKQPVSGVICTSSDAP
jgi:hypothetical protein